MSTEVIPVLHVADAGRAVEWYAVLGFSKDWEHRFEPGLPAYVQVGRDGAHLHLSEHEGDARPGTLIYLWVADVDAAAAAVGVPGDDIDEMEWGRDFEVRDGTGCGWAAGARDAIRGRTPPVPRRCGPLPRAAPGGRMPTPAHCPRLSSYGG